MRLSDHEQPKHGEKALLKRPYSSNEQLRFVAFITLICLNALARTLLAVKRISKTLGKIFTRQSPVLTLCT